MPGSVESHTIPTASTPAASSLRVPEWVLGFLSAVFFLSGAAALIYQVLWLRLLALIFGVTVHAASAVLATVMAGLALGSYVGGRLGDRARRPLLVFGGVELLVGLSALATPGALELVKRLYVILHPVLGDALPLLTLARLLLTCVVLLVPTSLMGATLPLVVRSSLFRAERLGTHVGLLYATNTAGAVAGVLLAGFYLIPKVGLTASFFLAALLNGTVALAALALSRALGPVQLSSAAAPPFAHAHSARHTAPQPALVETTRRLVLVIFSVSGFTSLALEVIWFRVLVIFLGPTSYAFSIMLSTVLAGIAVGSAIVTPWLRRQIDWLAVLVLVEIGIAIAALLSFGALAFVDPAAAYVEQVGQTPQAGADYVGRVLAGSIFAILPTAVLQGVAFPIGVRIWAADDPQGRRSAARVGVFYATNVCGAILGPLVAGFVLLPALGSSASLVAIAAMVLASAFLLLRAASQQRRRFAVVIGLAGALAFAVTAAYVVPAFDLALGRVYASERLLWRDEGVQTTVKVNARPGPDGRPMRILYVDGWHQANDSPATLFVDRLIGVLPVALHPDPQRALVIGLGGGATPGAITRFPGVHVDIVELSPSVVRAADEWFGHVNFDLLQQPNARLRIGDGRNYLLLTRERYDVITADVIVPRHSGSGNLYSVEYFQSARRALTPNGLILQWLPDESDVEYRTIMRTFLSAFPHATLWARGSLLVGTAEPLSIRRGEFERRLADPGTRAALELAGISSFEMLLLLYTAGPDELRTYAGVGPILTDNRPLVEYFLSLRHDERPVEMTGLEGDVMRHVLP